MPPWPTTVDGQRAPSSPEVERFLAVDFTDSGNLLGAFGTSPSPSTERETTLTRGRRPAANQTFNLLA